MSDLLHQSPLGKTSQYETRYNPDLLFPIARQEKRTELGITGKALPFYGRDLWYGYELSWLNSRGKPEVRIVRIELPCQSANLIESKSLKLYLNSFNQSRFADEDAVRQCLERDLSACAGDRVQVTLFTVAAMECQGFQAAPGINLDALDIAIQTYTYDPGLLQKETGRLAETLHSHLLKSNCPVTGQPDWGTLVVAYQGEAIDHGALLEYICSFREHQEFHEQCVERIFTDLMAHFALDELTVYAQYLRRGGLDINPWRSTCKSTPDCLRFIRQ